MTPDEEAVARVLKAYENALSTARLASAPKRFVAPMSLFSKPFG
jgi:hypothetical protein